LRTVRVRDTEYHPNNAAFDDVDHGGVTRRTVGPSAATDQVVTSILPVRTEGAGGCRNGLTSVPRLIPRHSSKELEVDVCPAVVAAAFGSTKTGSGAVLFRR
jgi:hypothetical protein